MGRATTEDGRAGRARVYVSNLRKALGAEVLITHGNGYLLEVAPEEVDVDRFEALRAEGRGLLAAGDTTEAADALGHALSLWRGPPLQDFAYEAFAQPEIARLEELRLATLEDRFDAQLAAGGDSELVADLEQLVEANPLRERLRAQLMLALYRSGRQADALEAYQRGRRLLVDELGLEPGETLRRLVTRILQQDPGLDVRACCRARRWRRPGGLRALAGWRYSASQRCSWESLRPSGS
jgi:DNA-binding SARP family transcriptional activator